MKLLFWYIAIGSFVAIGITVIGVIASAIMSLASGSEFISFVVVKIPLYVLCGIGIISTILALANTDVK